MMRGSGAIALAESLFKKNLSDEDQGLIWGFFEIFRQKATGLFSMEWPASGREAFRKEIAFQSGEPVAIVSNRGQESLGKYLLSLGRLSAEDFQKYSEWIREQGRDWIQCLLHHQVLQNHELPEILEGHFKFRLFQPLNLSRGEMEFKRLGQLPARAVNAEPVKLSRPIMEIFWPSIKDQLTEDYCRSRLSKQGPVGVRIRSECPVPLGPTELREWNQLMKGDVLIRDVSGSTLSLLVLAMELNLLRWGESPDQKIKNEIYVLLQKFRKAAPTEVLGVTLSSSVEEVKKAHLQWIKKYHPDRLPPGSSAELRKSCEELMALVNEAYDVLSDPVKRENYEAEVALEKMGGRKAIEEQLQAELKYDEALVALRRKQYKLAYEGMLPLAEKLKENALFPSDLHFAKFMMEMEAKSFNRVELPKILKIFDESSQKVKDSAWPLYYKALALKMLGEADKALAVFDILVREFPKFSEAASEARFLRAKLEKGKKAKGGGSWFKRG